MVVGTVRLFPRLYQVLAQLSTALRAGPATRRTHRTLEARRKRRLPGAKQARANLFRAFLQRDAQAARNERTGQLCAAKLLRTRLHQLVVEVRRNIVVVAVEGTLTDARRRANSCSSARDASEMRCEKTVPCAGQTVGQCRCSFVHCRSGSAAGCGCLRAVNAEWRRIAQAAEVSEHCADPRRAVLYTG